MLKIPNNKNNEREKNKQKISKNYNLENKNKPVFFTVGNGGYYELTINNQLVVSRYYNRGELFKYKFDINENDTIVQLKINDIVVITRSINVSTVEECKKFGVRGKIK